MINIMVINLEKSYIILTDCIDGSEYVASTTILVFYLSKFLRYWTHLHFSLAGMFQIFWIWATLQSFSCLLFGI